MEGEIDGRREENEGGGQERTRIREQEEGWRRNKGQNRREGGRVKGK